jgi:dTDP-4-dehydrorhamnose reductase
MSIIGPEIKNGVGLFNFIYNNPDTDIPGWENAWWNGITTLQLAKCIDNYMKNPCVTGIYHLVNNDISINKYELLCLINKIYNLNKNIIKTKGPKDINKILIDTRQEFQANIPDYDTQLIEMKKYV